MARATPLARRPVPAGPARAGLVVLGGLAGVRRRVYVVVVLGGGALIGQTDSPSLPLSVARHRGRRPRLRARAAPARAVAPPRWLRGGTPSPYDVLSRFSETVTGGYATEELPGRMATLLGEGTGAEWAQVWLTVRDRLDARRDLAARRGDARVTEPPEPATTPATRPATAGGRCRCATAGRCSACSGCRSARAAADHRRGAAVHRAGRPGRAGAAAGRPAGRAGGPRTPSCRRAPPSCARPASG